MEPGDPAALGDLGEVIRLVSDGAGLCQYRIQYDGIGGICAAGKANREAERFCTGASGSLYAVYPIYAVGNAGGALYVSGNLVCGAGHQLYQE